MRNIAQKQDNVGDVLPAGAFNSNQNEMENLVTDTGQLLDLDLNIGVASALSLVLFVSLILLGRLLFVRIMEVMERT